VESQDKTIILTGAAIGGLLTTGCGDKAPPRPAAAPYQPTGELDARAAYGAQTVRQQSAFVSTGGSSDETSAPAKCWQPQMRLDAAPPKAGSWKAATAGDDWQAPHR
jgi:hypothetical protein